MPSLSAATRSSPAVRLHGQCLRRERRRPRGVRPWPGLADRQHVDRHVSVREGGGAALSYCADSTVSDNTFAENTVFPFPDQEGREAVSEVTGTPRAAACGRRRARLGCQDVGARRPRVRTLTEVGNAFRANALDVGPDSPAAVPASTSRAASWTRPLTCSMLTRSWAGARAAAAARRPDAWSGEPVTATILVATANEIPDGEGGAINYATDVSAGGTVELLDATIPADDAGDGDGGAIDGRERYDLGAERSIVHGNAGSEQISGSRSRPRDAGRPGPGTRTVSDSSCAPARARSRGEGNLCADLSRERRGGDVDETSAQPTLEARVGDPSPASLPKDYEGQTPLSSTTTRHEAVPSRTWGADEAPAPGRHACGPHAADRTARRPAACSGRRRAAGPRRAIVQDQAPHPRAEGRQGDRDRQRQRVKVLRGKRLTSRVDLRGLPNGRSRSDQARARQRQDDLGVRRYFTCLPGRRSGPPKV